MAAARSGLKFADYGRKSGIRIQTGNDADQAGGRPKCMSGQQLERTRHVPARVAIPGDMEQAEKSIRVRNAGATCVLWPVRLRRRTLPVCLACGLPALTMRAPRARRFAQSFRTPLWDTEDKKKTGNPGPDENTGDDACPES